ncbi:hypothetical protein HPB51_001411 [Rhipicephalus microplus]|uniref:Cadherin domain-containing protein n=1 Tax=Rhipicephalus microplus TaxID=6941 RepID=A0A9J6EEC6_RHIMP|nr:hypothetical protein HPB51_001411 [Rhipicephalus microplus]
MSAAKAEVKRAGRLRRTKGTFDSITLRVRPGFDVVDRKHLVKDCEEAPPEGKGSLSMTRKCRRRWWTLLLALLCLTPCVLAVRQFSPGEVGEEGINPCPFPLSVNYDGGASGDRSKSLHPGSIFSLSDGSKLVGQIVADAAQTPSTGARATFLTYAGLSPRARPLGLWPRRPEKVVSLGAVMAPEKKVGEEKRNAASVKVSDDVRTGNCQLGQSSVETATDVCCSDTADDRVGQSRRSRPVQGYRSFVVRLADRVGKTLKYDHGCRNKSKSVANCARRLCEVEGGGTVVIMDIQESRGNQTDQETQPRELPVVGDIQDIELSIQSATYDVFQLLGKRLILKRPLDRDADDLASIRLQVLCQARLGRVQLAPVGTTIFRDLATMDMDTGTNGLVEYTTVPGDGSDNDGYDYFAIDLPYQGLVTVAKPLDYERAKYYHLVIKATDTASNLSERLSSTTTLTVFVEDGDDQGPAFVYKGCALVHGACTDVEYSAEVTSGLTSGIVKTYPEDIRAEDRDSLKSKIVYSFVNGTPSFYHSYFDIDKESGLVRQLKPADRALAKSYDIIVKAEEETPSRRFATARLTISVRVVDSNPPILLASATEGFVDENSPIGTYVVTQPGGDEPLYFMVSDDDIAEDDPLPEYTFELTTTAFRVNSEGILVVNEQDLDRDPPNQNVHTFQVVAHQMNSEPGKGSSAPISLSVRLNDVNDNSPKLPTLSPVTIQAGDGVRNVTQVQARDDDEGEFARISYSVYHVSNNGRDKFRIDPNTGVVQVIGRVSSGEQYSITVQATDSGARFSQGILDVIVIPGPNTGGPVFSKEKYEAQVSEGASVGSAVLTLKVCSLKQNCHHELARTLFTLLFILQPVFLYSCAPRTRAPIYPAWDAITVVVERTSTDAVTDINDQNPVFVQDSYNFTVEEGKAGAVVGTVQARDEDVGANGEVYYTIAGNGDFGIDEQTGEVTTRRALDYERQREHVFVVTAKDKAPDARITTASVTVRVQDVQDERPYFERAFYETSVPENQNNINVVQVKVRTYTHLTAGGGGGWAEFTMFLVDGTIAGLDYEKKTSHTLIIGTLENDANEAMATCTVRVAVEDRNDVAPRFASVPLPIRLQDTVPLGTIVTTVVATDGDGSAPGNVVRYEISGQGRAPFYFLIDSTSGVITVKDDLRKEPDSEYRIEVQANDLGDPSLAATAVVTVYVEHIATVPPDSGLGFADGFYTVEVPENALANTLVKSLPIINKPRGNFPVQCQIVTGNEKGHFYILDNEQRDCEVRVQNQNLDYEEQNKYLLTVHLNTIGGVFGSSRLTTQVAVHLIDQNDNRPRFVVPPMYSQLTQNRYLAALSSDAPAGTRFIQVTAEDLDSGSNGKIVYDLSPDSDPEGKFSIDPQTGYLSNVKTFDDLQNVELPLKLKVTARDSPDLTARALTESTYVYVNLIRFENRLVLAIGDVLPDKVLQLKDHIMSIIQQQTRLIASVEKVVALKVLRNNTIVTDFSGSDIWMFLVEPESLRILTTNDPRVQMLVSSGSAQSSFLDHLSRSLGITAQQLRTPYAPPTAPPNLVRPVKIAGGDSSDLGAALIVLACIIAVLGFVGIVYHCCMWSRYVANKERIKRMCVAPRYEPVYADSSLKEYETQVLQMSVPVDEDGSCNESPLGLKGGGADVAYLGGGRTAYERESPSSIGNASTARVGSCASATFDDAPTATRNPLYVAYNSDEEEPSPGAPSPAAKTLSGLTMLKTHPPTAAAGDKSKYIAGVETTTEL